jgi:ATP-dependent Clp protease adaptor protein ClpS
MSKSKGAVAEPEEHTRAKRAAQQGKPKRQPRYHVILWDDPEHTFHYVIHMCQKLFGYPLEKGMSLAKQVHNQGRAILLTTTKEHAELKQEQIHAFGSDPLASRCSGSMSATIEPEI